MSNMDDPNYPFRVCQCGLKESKEAWEAGGRACPECQAVWPENLRNSHPLDGGPPLKQYITNLGSIMETLHREINQLIADNKAEIADLRFLCHEAAEWIHQMGVHGADKPNDCPDCQLAGRLKAAARGDQ